MCENVYEADKKEKSVIYCCTHGTVLPQDSVIYCCSFSSMQKILKDGLKKKKNGANGKAVSDEATVQSGSKYKLGLIDILFSQKQFNKYY